MDSKSQSDEAFVQKLRSLDQAAWTELFDTHHEMIWRYVLIRTGNHNLADDITSQVFVEALESIQRIRYQGKPVLAWLYRIARNHLGKHIRLAKREPARSGRDSTKNPIDSALDAIVLSEALTALTQDQADAVVLRFYSGYSTPEIAAAMGKSESAVYSLQIRAMAALRRYLEHHA